VELQDYREVRGTFDRIVSIGMFEHVGAEYWEPFFRRCRALLAPGGRLVLQTITVPDAALRSHLARPGWLQRYIFPGAALPSVAAIERASSRAGLRLRRVEDIGPHYATTLRHWRERFQSSLPAVRALGYDERFTRQWLYYLCLSEAGFRAGVTSDVQVVLDR
jgi:cyclopropane-fatty-acyl-phospholipid synthase